MSEFVLCFGSALTFVSIDWQICFRVSTNSTFTNLPNCRQIFPVCGNDSNRREVDMRRIGWHTQGMDTRRREKIYQEWILGDGKNNIRNYFSETGRVILGMNSRRREEWYEEWILGDGKHNIRNGFSETGEMISGMASRRQQTWLGIDSRRWEWWH